MTDDLTAEQRHDLCAVQELEPDMDDIPGAPAENWAQAKRINKPRKEAISLRLDADVLD